MRTREPDETCAQAVDLARQAAGELAGPGGVGGYVGAEADGDRVVTHLFECLNPAYQGWRWAVTVARAARAKNVTVSEILLVPGPDAILAPPWVPWRERLRPGDLGVGDILPAAPDDDRLVPAVALEGEDGVEEVAEVASAVAELALPEPGSPAEAELAPGRARVLSAIGRDDAAIRWYDSDHGPKSPYAHAAPGICRSCGFFVRLGGPLGQVFGVCANEYAPDDGTVVSVDHGCGAHSEALQDPGSGRAARPLTGDLRYGLADLPGVSIDDTVFESLEHG